MAGRAALIYISVGALTAIWAGVWSVYLYNNPPTESAYTYWCTGFLVTGICMLLIGLGLGAISRSAAPADLQPTGVPVPMVNVNPDAAAAPVPVLAPLNVTSPVVAPNGKVVQTQPTSLLPG
jgi:hypothetical protein